MNINTRVRSKGVGEETGPLVKFRADTEKKISEAAKNDVMSEKVHATKPGERYASAPAILVHTYGSTNNNDTNRSDPDLAGRALLTATGRAFRRNAISQPSDFNRNAIQPGEVPIFRRSNSSPNLNQKLDNPAQKSSTLRPKEVSSSPPIRSTSYRNLDEKTISDEKTIQMSSSPLVMPRKEVREKIRKESLSKLASSLDDEINRINKSYEQKKPLKDSFLEKINLKEKEKSIPIYKTAEDIEKLERLKLLKNKLNDDPDYFVARINAYQNTPMYQYFGAEKFFSILVKSDQNIAISGNPHHLSEEERVALYAYTTSEYRIINNAAREAKSNNKEMDKGIDAWGKLIDAALKKLPDASAVDSSGKPVVIMRAFYLPTAPIPPKPTDDDAKKEEYQIQLAQYQTQLEKFNAFVDKTLQEGVEFNDGAYSSTTTTGMAVGAVKVTIVLPEGAKTIPHAKSISFPYSAFGKPDSEGEGEVLFERSAIFKITNVIDKNEGKKTTEININKTANFNILP